MLHEFWKVIICDGSFEVLNEKKNTLVVLVQIGTYLNGNTTNLPMLNQKKELVESGIKLTENTNSIVKTKVIEQWF